MLDICPHLVPPLSYDSVAGSQVWIPEYEPPQGRKIIPEFDPIAFPPEYQAIAGNVTSKCEEEVGEDSPENDKESLVE